MLRRTRSGDRCPRSRGSLLPDGAELQFTAAEESLAVAPPGEGCAAAGGEGPLPTRGNLLQAAPCLPHRAGGWGSRGEPESVGWYGAGQWGCPSVPGAPVQGSTHHSSPSLPLQSRPKGPPQSAAAPAAESPQPPALHPAPSAGPTQDSPPRRPPAPRLEDGEAAAVHPVGLRPSTVAPRAGARLQGLSCLSITDPAGSGPSVYASIP